MFDHMDGLMRPSAEKKTPSREDLFIPVKLAPQIRSKHYAEVTPTTGMLLVSEYILDTFRKLRWFRRCDKGMNIYPGDATSSTTQYAEAFAKYVENKYCANHRRVPVKKHKNVPNSNVIHSATCSGSSQSSFDPYDSSSDDEEYITLNNAAETTPRWSDCTAPLLFATRLYLNSPPKALKNWGQINANLNDCHCDPMEMSSRFWLPDKPDWWRWHEETHSKYADHSNVARDAFSIIPHGVGVEASFSLGWDVIGWRQSKTTGETHHEKLVERQFARANHRILAGCDPLVDTTITETDSEMNKEVAEREFHRMANVHDLLEMWQGSQNLCNTQKESHAHNK